MAELTFTYGTMAAGKSTLALQLCWQLREGRSDVALWTFGDRSDDGMVTSRIGIEAEAEAVAPGSDLAARVEAPARRRHQGPGHRRGPVRQRRPGRRPGRAGGRPRRRRARLRAVGGLPAQHLPGIGPALRDRRLGPRTAAHLVVLVRAARAAATPGSSTASSRARATSSSTATSTRASCTTRCSVAPTTASASSRRRARERLPSG